MSIGRRGDASVAARTAARLRTALRRGGREGRGGRGPARRWAGAATASAVVAPLVLVALLAEGNAVRELAQTTGSAWVASPQQGVVTLVDGASDAIAAALRVPAAATLEVEQAGSSAFVVDDAAGTVARVDGATYQVTAAVRLGTPGGSLSVLQGVDDVYVLDATRRTATVVDPRTLGALDEVPLGAQPGPGQAVVDDAGRLWVVDGDGGGLTWFDGTHHVARDAADADERLVLVRGRPVLVDVAEGTVAPLDDDGAVGRRSCLEARTGDTVQVLGSADRDEVVAAIAETGTLVVAAVGRDDCGRVVAVEEPGTPVDFGPLAQSGRYVFVPNHLTGQVVVVDLRTDEVAGRLDLTPAGNRLQLVAKDGVVFYNDLDGDTVGVLHLDGRTWVAGEALSKFDPTDGEPVAVVVPDPGPSPDGPAADAGTPPSPEADAQGTRPTAPPRSPGPAPSREPATPRPGAGPPAPGGDRPGPGPTTTSPTPASVSVDVAGDGRVTSSPPGIDCPGTCQGLFPPGTRVTLTAAPGGSAAHLAWSGACRDVPAGDPCGLDVTAPATAGAQFGVPPARVTVVVEVVGAGRVESDPPGISCDPASSPCTAEFPADVGVLLTAVADPGVAAGSWSGDCTDRHCELAPGTGGHVTATFEHPRLLRVDPPTGGRVTGSAIDCPGVCEEWLAEGTVITLTATPDEDAQLAGWAQDCSGTSPTCELTIDADPAVAATFSAYPVGPFVGDWRQTGGAGTARAVVVATSPTTATVEYWGNCTPTGCPWSTESGSVHAGELLVVFDFEHRPEVTWDTHTTLRREGDRLRAAHVERSRTGRPDLTYEHLHDRAG